MQLLENISNKTAKYFGFDASYISHSVKMNAALIESASNGASSLSDYIYYRYFDKEEELFFLEGRVCGFMLEIQPIVGVDESLIKNLDYFFNKELPYDSFMQFFLLASSDVEPILKDWAGRRINPHPTLQKITQKNTQFIQRMANKYGDYDGRLARDFKIYISFSRACNFKPKELKEIAFFKRILIKKLETIKLGPKTCSDADLIKLLKEFFEFTPGKPSNYKSRDRKVTLNEQIVSAGVNFHLEDDGFTNTSSKVITRSYSPKELPEEGSLLAMINLLGCSRQENVGIPARFAISYTVATTIDKPGQEGMQARGRKVIEAAESWRGRGDRSMQRDAAEWRDLNDRAKNRERFLTESFQVMISSPSEFIEESEAALLGMYNSLDWKLSRNDKLHLPVILSCLPMQQSLYWSALCLHKQVKICMSDEVTAKLPIHAEWKGVPEPGILLFGRRGQLFHWNPFYRISSGNYNVCVFGPSGGGKSVFLNVMATSMMAQNARVFILDIGKSFADVANLLNGEIVQFGREVKLALNPFAGFNASMSSDDFNDLVKCAKELLIIMCGVDSDRGAAELEKAIKDSVQKANYKLDINGFASALEQSKSELLQGYAATLYSYTKEGIYGKYFSGAKSASFKEQITIFEFEEIKKDKKLLAIILQILLMEITNQFFTGDRSQRFMIIVDEAWMLLDYAAGFFAEFARTVRKYGGSLVTCVQNFNDLQETKARRDILENSTWTVMLKQDEKGLGAFKESEAFKDILPLIKSISLAPGKYSEMLLSATGVNFVGRLVLDEYSNALYSTDSADYNYLMRAQEEGLTLDVAIEKLAQEKSARG